MGRYRGKSKERSHRSIGEKYCSHRDEERAASKARPGLLFRKGPLVRMTRTIIDAEMTDSINQPVLNSRPMHGK